MNVFSCLLNSVQVTYNRVNDKLWALCDGCRLDGKLFHAQDTAAGNARSSTLHDLTMASDDLQRRDVGRAQTTTSDYL